MGIFSASPKQRYAAAYALYLAGYTHRELPAGEQARVDQKVYDSMNGFLGGFSPIEFQRLWRLSMKSAWRAYAMQELGIPPAMKGEEWQLPRSRRWLGSLPTGPGKLSTAYFPYGDAAARAKSDLAAKGLDLHSIDLSVI